MMSLKFVVITCKSHNLRSNPLLVWAVFFLVSHRDVIYQLVALLMSFGKVLAPSIYYSNDHDQKFVAAIHIITM